MPAVSEAQRRHLNARFGHQWVRKHHMDNKGKLPRRVGKGDLKRAADGAWAKIQAGLKRKKKG